MPQYVQDRLNLYDAVLLLQGLGNTVALCLLGLSLGTLIALFVGLARASHSRWLSWPAGLYIEIIRDSPLLMQLYLVFFALPLLGLNVPIFMAGVATLMVNSSAFMAEIVRGGIQSVAKDQWDAARGLGMGYPQVMRWVVIPQAFRVMVPEYYSASCLSCHGSPKGETDITGYPKEGGHENDLGGVISLTLYK